MVGVLYKMANFAKFQRLCHPLFVAATFDWGVLGDSIEPWNHETSMSQR